MFNCSIKPYVPGSTIPILLTAQKAQNLCTVAMASWQQGLRAFLPHHTFPSLHPLILFVFLSWISSLDWVTDFRTR